MLNSYVSGLFNGISNFIEDGFAWTSSFAFGADLPSYVWTETNATKNTVILRDCSQMTVFEIMGNGNLVGDAETFAISDSLAAVIKPYLRGPGHAIGVMFERDRDRIKGVLEAMTAPQRQTATNLGLDCEDVIADREARLADCCAYERCFLVLLTRPTIIDKERAKKERKERLALAKKWNLPALRDAQSPFYNIADISVRHEAMVEVVEKDLSVQVGLMVRKLTAHEAMREGRMALDAEVTSPTWRPALFGDRFIPRRASMSDASNIFPPKLSVQAAPRSAEIVNDITLKIGGRHNRTMVAELGPVEVQTFDRLFRRIGDEIPYRVTFWIEAGGIKRESMKDSIVSVIGFLGDNNKRLKSTFDYLKELDKNEEVVTCSHLTFATWANSTEALDRRSSALIKIVDGWGGVDITETVGDAVGAYVSTVPMLTPAALGANLLPPLKEICSMLPVARPASPWESGILFRTPDGKLFPFAAGSSKQSAWIDLIFAPSGSGKSVLLNILNMGFCLRPGLMELPLTAIIDVGPSSLGLINLLKDSLPAERKHEAGYFRLLMSPEYAINPFDTQLGRRFPMAIERSFLGNFITLLLTPQGSKKPYAAAQELAGALVDEAYKKFSDAESPRIYEPHVEQAVDVALAEIAFSVDRATSWWEVVDALFDAGQIHAATLANRHAVPRFSDLTAVLQLPAVRDTFIRSADSRVMVETGETLIDAATRVISAATREYPVLGGPTRFDIGDCRVVSIDLNEVARGNTEAEKRQAALMFMLARFAGAKNFYIKDETIVDANCPQRYRAYHKRRADEIWPTPKAIRFDEFHRTGGIEALRNQVKQDMREGRKWNTQITLASQFLVDFMDEDNVMATSATSVFVMRSQDDQTNEEMRRLFGLPQVAIDRLRLECHGPQGARGANMLAIFVTNQMRVTQILNNRAGPVELWAFSTTSDDMVLRGILYDELGGREARRILAERFPGGTAVEEFERRRRNLLAGDDPDVVRTVAKEILASCRSGVRRAA